MSSLVFSKGFLLRVVFFALTYVVLGVLFPLQQGAITVTYVIGLTVTGLLYGLLLGTALTHFTVGRKARIVLILPPLFVIQWLNPLIEGYVFTTRLNDVTLLVGGVLFGLLLSLAYALVAGALFVPSQATQPLGQQIRTYFAQRAGADWLWRTVIVALSWAGFYFIFGSVIGPIVTPYYTDPSSPYQLRLLGVEVIAAVQVMRGFVYTGALIPIRFALKHDMWYVLLVLVGLLYAGGGLAILVIVETFPLVLRVVHGIEILADSLCFGAVATYLLGTPRHGTKVD
jgi:hypothetical protein